MQNGFSSMHIQSTLMASKIPRNMVMSFHHNFYRSQEGGKQRTFVIVNIIFERINILLDISQDGGWVIQF